MYEVEYCSNIDKYLSVLKSYGKDVAFRLHTGEVTYEQLYLDVIKIAAGLQANYERKIIRINMRNSCSFAAAYLAVVLSGNIALLSEEEVGDISYELEITEDVLDQMRKAAGKPVGCRCGVGETEVSTLLMSSGSTAKKKYVMLSQRNIFTDTISGMRNYEYKKGCTYVNVIPYTHLFGLVADLLGPLYSGGIICVLESKYEFFDSLKKYQPQALNLPPFMIELICDRMKKDTNPELFLGGRLKKIMCAGARLDEKINEYLNQYGVQVYTAYGLTECSPCVSLSGDHSYCPGSVGKVLDCCEVKIVDGEILVKGSNVMIGYYNAPKETAQVIKDGWLYTGDIGRIENDYLFIEGRKNILLVFSNGYKMNPEQLEEKLNQIEDVKESVVYLEKNGIDEKLVIRATVEEQGDQNIIMDRIKSESEMIHNIVIGKIELVTENLPRTNLGKLIRRRTDEGHNH